MIVVQAFAHSALVQTTRALSATDSTLATEFAAAARENIRSMIATESLIYTPPQGSNYPGALDAGRDEVREPAVVPRLMR